MAMVAASQRQEWLWPPPPWPAPWRSITTARSSGDGRAFNHGYIVPIHVHLSRCQGGGSYFVTCIDSSSSQYLNINQIAVNDTPFLGFGQDPSIL